MTENNCLDIHDIVDCFFVFHTAKSYLIQQKLIADHSSSCDLYIIIELRDTRKKYNSNKKKVGRNGCLTFWVFLDRQKKCLSHDLLWNGKPQTK